MKKKIFIMVISAAVIFSVQNVRAENNIGLTAKAGTLGYGGDLTVKVVKKVNLRAGINMLNFDGPELGDGKDKIKTKLDWQTIGGLADRYPGDSDFRLSAGAFSNKNQIKLSANTNSMVKIGDTEYTVSDLQGKISFNDIAPYVGIGYGNAVGEDGNWHFSLMMQGSPKVNMAVVASDPTLQMQLNSKIKDETTKIEDKIKTI